MKVLKIIAAVTAGLLISTTALACNQQEAEDKWVQAEKGGIILGMATIQGVSSFAVDLSTWNQLDYNTRVSMMKNFECLISGPGNVLRKAHVITEGGRILAIWDGVSQELEIR